MTLDKATLQRMSSIDYRLQILRENAERAILELKNSGWKPMPDISRGDVLSDVCHQNPDRKNKLTGTELIDFKNKEIINASCLVRSYIEGYYAGKNKGDDNYAQLCLIEIGRYSETINMLYYEGYLLKEILSRIERGNKTKAQWNSEERERLYDSAVDCADKLWNEGDGLMHHHMAEFLCGLDEYKGVLRKPALMEKLKPTAEKYGKLFGVKKIRPPKEHTPT